MSLIIGVQTSKSKTLGEVFYPRVRISSIESAGETSIRNLRVLRNFHLKRAMLSVELDQLKRSGKSATPELCTKCKGTQSKLAPVIPSPSVSGKQARAVRGRVRCTAAGGEQGAKPRFRPCPSQSSYQEAQEPAPAGQQAATAYGVRCKGAYGQRKFSV